MEREFTPVLDFRFRETTPDQWFLGAGPDLDDLIRNRFGRRIKDGREGKLDAWANAPRGRLALILVLDQFSRNVFRNNPEAFAGQQRHTRFHAKESRRRWTSR